MVSQHQEALVTAVVPSHNRSEILTAAMDSIWEQTYRPIEVIVVDDGSTDNTREVVKQWCIKTNEANFAVRYVYQKNQGANAARNRGIIEASGDFVAFLDSDDRWLPDKLSRQIPVFVNHPEIGGVYCGLRYIDLETDKLAPFENKSYPQGWLLSELLVSDVTAGTPCYIIKKSCFDQVGMFDVDLPARQDWDMWIRLATKYQIVCIPEVLVHAGTHSGDRIGTNPNDEIEANWLVYRKYEALRAKHGLRVRLKARATLFRRLGRLYFHRNLSNREAMKMYMKALLVWPFSFNSYAAIVGMVLPRCIRVMIHHRWNRVFGKTRFAIRSL